MPTKWAENWQLMSNLLAQLKADLGTEAYHAAWERGKHLTHETIEQELRTQLLQPES